MKHTLHITGNPKPQGSKTLTQTGHMIEANKHHKQWRQTAQTQLKTQWQPKPPLDQPLHITATFWLPKPKKPRWPQPATTYDLDKLMRALGDSLEKAQVITNDNRITTWHTQKRYTQPGQQPGVTITIQPDHTPQAGTNELPLPL